MESKARALGHPVHPMLVVFPLGLLTGASLFDSLYLFTRRRRYSAAAFWTLSAGLAGGLLAALFGTVDYLAIPRGTRARIVGITHGAGNALVVLLSLASWLMRRRPERHVPSIGALVFSLFGVGLSFVTGWLGGELVYRLGVGVDPGAHLDAPSSLSGEPATEAVPGAPLVLTDPR
jgi:uncharacterized membrane protein